MDKISIAAISAIISIIATIWALNRDSRRDTRQEVETNVTVKEEIKYISRGVEDIKYDTRSLTSTISGMNDRLIRVEESAKNAHKRIDDINKETEV